MLGQYYAFLLNVQSADCRSENGQSVPTPFLCVWFRAGTNRRNLFPTTGSHESEGREARKSRASPDRSLAAVDTDADRCSDAGAAPATERSAALDDSATIPADTGRLAAEALWFAADSGREALLSARTTRSGSRTAPARRRRL